MNDDRIPSIFREALDEPAPPAPPEVDPEDDDDSDGHYAHMLCPVVMVMSNGGVQTTGLVGTVLVTLAIANALIVAWLAWSWLWTSLTALVTVTFLVSLLAELGLFIVCLALWAGGSVLWGWWRTRRAARKATQP